MSARILCSEAPHHVSETSFIEDIYVCMINGSKKTFAEEVRNRKEYTYHDVLEMSTNFAELLWNLGLGEGDVLTICADNSTIESYIVVLGVWLSGITLSPIIPDSNINEMRRFLEITRSKAIYCDSEFSEKINLIVEQLDWKIFVIVPNAIYPNIDYYACQKCENYSNFVLKSINKDKHLLSIMFTSGTSGEPKGTELRSEALKCNIPFFPWDQGKKFLVVSQLFWVTNPLCFLRTILAEGSIIIPETTTTEALLSVITDYKPQMLLCAPKFFMSMCEIINHQEHNLSSLEKVYYGGAYILVEAKRMIVNKLFGGRNIFLAEFGSTEVGFVTAMDLEVDINSDRYASIGKVIPGMKVKVIDVDTGEMLGPFQNGEICVKAPSVLRKYVQRFPTRDELDDEGWWHMGDMVYYDEEGYIYYITRLKEIMKYRGRHIAPAELEKIIYQHPDVIECCVVGKPHDTQGEIPTAFVVKQPDSKVTESEIFNLVSENVTDPKKLRGGVHFLNSLPRNPVGKPLRIKLVELAKNL